MDRWNENHGNMKPQWPAPAFTNESQCDSPIVPPPTVKQPTQRQRWMKTRDAHNAALQRHLMTQRVHYYYAPPAESVSRASSHSFSTTSAAPSIPPATVSPRLLVAFARSALCPTYASAAAAHPESSSATATAAPSSPSSSPPSVHGPPPRSPLAKVASNAPPQVASLVSVDPEDIPALPHPPPPPPVHWPHILSAIGAGIITAVFSSPFDVIRTRLAVQQNTKGVHYKGIIGSFRITYKEEGIRGLYRGFGPTIIVVPAFWSLYFTTYNGFKHFLSQSADGHGTGRVSGLFSNMPLWGQHLFAAIGAGAFADVICNPLFVVRTLQQTQHMKMYAEAAAAAAAAAASGKVAPGPTHLTAALRSHRTPGSFSIVRRLIREDGWLSLFRGTTASLLGLSHVCIQFPAYEKLKVAIPMMRQNARERQRAESKRHTMHASLPSTSHSHPAAATSSSSSSNNGSSPSSCLPAPSSSSPSSSSTPSSAVPEADMFDLIGASASSKVLASSLTYSHEVLRARMQNAEKGVFNGLIHCATKTVKEEGVMALYKGFGVNLIRTVPGCALTFVSYELLLKYLAKHYVT